MTSEEQRIREFAYQIWQSEGCPHGQDERHWEMARKLVEAERTPAGAVAKPATSRTRKPAAAKPAEPAPAPASRAQRAAPRPPQPHRKATPTHRPVHRKRSRSHAPLAARPRADA